VVTTFGLHWNGLPRDESCAAPVTIARYPSTEHKVIGDPQAARRLRYSWHSQPCLAKWPCDEAVTAQGRPDAERFFCVGGLEDEDYPLEWHCFPCDTHLSARDRLVPSVFREHPWSRADGVVEFADRKRIRAIEEERRKLRRRTGNARSRFRVANRLMEAGYPRTRSERAVPRLHRIR
jgi:hypothetical protein